MRNKKQLNNLTLCPLSINVQVHGQHSTALRNVHCCKKTNALWFIWSRQDPWILLLNTQKSFKAFFFQFGVLYHQRGAGCLSYRVHVYPCVWIKANWSLKVNSLSANNFFWICMFFSPQTSRSSSTSSRKTPNSHFSASCFNSTINWATHSLSNVPLSK